MLELSISGVNQPMLDALKGLEVVQALAETEAGTVKLTTAGPGAIHRIADVIEKHGGEVQSMNTHETHLEDVFLHLTGTEMRVEMSDNIPTGATVPGRKSKRVR